MRLRIYKGLQTAEDNKQYHCDRTGDNSITVTGQEITVSL